MKKFYQNVVDINLSCKYEDYRKISNISFNIASNQKEAYSIFDKFYIDIINGNILGENENLQSVQEKTIFVFHLTNFSNNCKLWKIKKGSRVEYLPKFGSALNLFVLDELKILNSN